MSINLVAINSQYVHSSLAVATISKMYSSYCRRYNAELPELTVTELSINDSFDSLIYNIMKPCDIYAFSVYIWNVELVKKLCEYIKSAQPESIIILGGPEVSYGCDIDCCDYIVSGEGERAFFALISEIYGQKFPSEWNYKAEGKVRSADNIINLDEIEFAYDENNISRYDNKIIYYESTRGCPFSCAYCLSSVCGKVRELSLERVFSDIDFFVAHNVKQVKFVDRTFNCNRSRADEIWNYIIKNAGECDTNFHFEIGADLLTESQLELLSNCPAGKIQLEAGIQSTYEPALDECCRHTDNEKLFHNVSKIMSCGNINLHIDLIAGLPYESFEIFSKSFNDAYKLNAHQLQLGFLKLLHGAPLNNMIEKHGFVFASHSPYEIIKNKYISFDEICRLKKIEDVLERFYNSQRFVLSLKNISELFDSPFEMFEKIADEFEKYGLIFTPVSTKVLFDFMSDFSKKFGRDSDEILLLDFFLSEKSEVVPSKLKYLSTYRDKSGSLIKASSERKNKKAQVRFINNNGYIIDYGCRDKVTGRFRLCEVVENADM